MFQSILENPKVLHTVIVRVWAPPVRYNRSIIADNEEVLPAEKGDVKLSGHHPLTIALDVALNAAFGRICTISKIPGYSDAISVTTNLTAGFIEVRIQTQLNWAAAVLDNAGNWTGTLLQPQSWLKIPGWLPAIQTSEITVEDVQRSLIVRFGSHSDLREKWLRQAVAGRHWQNAPGRGFPFLPPNLKDSAGLEGTINTGEGALYKIAAQALEEEPYIDKIPSSWAKKMFTRRPATKFGF